MFEFTNAKLDACSKYVNIKIGDEIMESEQLQSIGELNPGNWFIWKARMWLYLEREMTNDFVKCWSTMDYVILEIPPNEEVARVYVDLNVTSNYVIRDAMIAELKKKITKLENKAENLDNIIERQHNTINRLKHTIETAVVADRCRTGYDNRQV